MIRDQEAEMQKWQYHYLMLNANYEVLEVNGEKYQSLSFFRAGEKVWDTLNRFGQEGWEVVGFSTWGERGWERIILKRPVQ
jgi:hypothetical protein